MPFSLKARIVFPIDRPPIDGGVVTIDDQRIVAVGTKAESNNLTDLGDVALLPGLVNAHTHLEFSHLQRPLGRPGMRLVDWIRLVIAERGRARSNVADAVRDGGREGLRHGVTTVGEIVSASADCYADFYASLTLFAEVIGFSQARASSALAAVREKLDGLRRYSQAELGISPHAPYTISLPLLTRLVTMANECVLPVAMHLAESAEELELLRTGTGPFRELLEERSMWDGTAIALGSRPLDYLQLLAESPRTLVIHGNYLDDEEQQFLAQHADHMSLVYCPRTHDYFQHPPYPLATLLSSGVHVALGTDSHASSPDLDLWAEMRHVFKKFPSVRPHAILRMGTLGSAKALGREWELGSITPGKFANLCCIPIKQRIPCKSDETLNGLLAGKEAVSKVWVHGTEN